MPPQCRQQARRETSRANLVSEITHASPPPLDQPCLEDVEHSTQECRARASANRVEYAPERHARPKPTDHAPPSPRAYMIATDPGDRQTSPFAAPCRTATARRRRRRLCRAERRVFQTKPHRPTSCHRIVEHRQGTP